MLNTKLKNKTWETADVNKTDFTDLEIGSISPATAKSIGITNATDYFQVIRIPWTYPYPNQLLLALSGKQKMYYRACSNGKWETPKQLLTNADLATGTQEVQFSSNSGEAHVNFGKTMPNVPVVILTPFGANPESYHCSAYNVTQAGFDLKLHVDNVESGSLRLYWVAITRNL